MFADYLRAAVAVAGAVLIGWVVNFVVPFFLPFLGAEDELLYQSFAAIAENATFIMLLAVGFAVLHRSLIQGRRTGGVRR